ncbi:MAG TPA: hypothetical protein VIH40_05270 [Xanthobacteraceae bacterium]
MSIKRSAEGAPSWRAFACARDGHALATSALAIVPILAASALAIQCARMLDFATTVRALDVQLLPASADAQSARKTTEAAPGAWEGAALAPELREIAARALPQPVFSIFSLPPPADLSDSVERANDHVCSPLIVPERAGVAAKTANGRPDC